MNREQLAAAFDEWMRRYIDEPEKFASDYATIKQFMDEELDGIEPTYGAMCAAYLDQINSELTNEHTGNSLAHIGS
jgi:hypothetical protein